MNVDPTKEVGPPGRKIPSSISYSSPLIASNGTNAFETNTATPSANEPDDSQCSGTFLDWLNSADIWFLYVAPSSGSVHFTGYP